MNPRRARPTLRVLQDDLRAGWESPHAQPLAGVAGLDPLSPLSELPHPIIRKALESFGDDPARDNYVGRIKSSTHLALLEIKSSQWRGGVWIDPDTGVCRLVAAGLAKGGHTDRDDFYERVKRADESGEIDRWLPTDDDRRQLKRETAARLLPDWELDIQRRVLVALRAVPEGGTTTFTLPHPKDSTRQFGNCTLTVAQVHEPNFEREEVVVEVDLTNEFRTSSLGWQATLRVLITISPPETGWDRVGETYSTIGETGSLILRLDQLQTITDRGQLAKSHPNDKAHYAHRRNLAHRSVAGIGVRSMCGVYFVPYQDHAALPTCAVCEAPMDAHSTIRIGQHRLARQLLGAPGGRLKMSISSNRTRHDHRFRRRSSRSRVCRLTLIERFAASRAPARPANAAPMPCSMPRTATLRRLRGMVRSGTCSAKVALCSRCSGR